MPAIRFLSAAAFVAFFRRWFDPTLQAFATLDQGGRHALAAALADLANRFDRHQDGGSVAIGATYLEAVLILR